MKRKALYCSTIIILSVLTISSCSKSSGGGGGGTTTVNCANVTNKAFAADVSPIIQSVCGVSGCHAAGSSNGPGALTNHAQVSAAATAIRSAVSTGRMPQGSTLSSSQKNSIICWIDSGTPDN